MSGEDWLGFESGFESGNLLMVMRGEECEIPTFDLYMQNDFNTKGCTQWFYFRVRN